MRRRPLLGRAVVLAPQSAAAGTPARPPRSARPQAERQADAESALSSLEGRCGRLSAELEEAAAAVEVLRAKGRAYDEVEARAERLVRRGRGRGRGRWGRLAVCCSCAAASGAVPQSIQKQSIPTPYCVGMLPPEVRLPNPTTQEAEVARLRPYEGAASQLEQRLRGAEEAARAAGGREAAAATEKAYMARELQVGRRRLWCLADPACLCNAPNHPSDTAGIQHTHARSAACPRAQALRDRVERLDADLRARDEKVGTQGGTAGGGGARRARRASGAGEAHPSTPAAPLLADGRPHIQITWAHAFPPPNPQISDLKRARAALHQRLHDADAAARAQDDGRLERELARLKAQAAADVDAIRRCGRARARPGAARRPRLCAAAPRASRPALGRRPGRACTRALLTETWPAIAVALPNREASEAAEREVRLMRDMRDAAIDEAARWGRAGECGAHSSKRARVQSALRAVAPAAMAPVSRACTNESPHTHPPNTQPRLKADLRDLTLAHESLQASSREGRLALDVRVAELVGEAKLRAFELQRAQVRPPGTATAPRGRETDRGV